MDKLIPVFNFLKNNRFWITCGLLSAAMIATWFIATNKLSEAQSAAESTIKQEISSAEKIIKTTAADVGKGVVAHPNDTTIAGMKAEIKEGTDAVIAAWELRRKKQEGLLVWPEVIGDKFINAFSQYSPFETFPVDKDPNDYLSLLKIYKLQIPDRMEAISAIIGTKWKFLEAKEDEGDQDEADGEGRPNRSDRRPGAGGRSRPGSRGGSIAASGEDDSVWTVVKWDEDNQQLWQDKLTTFSGFDDNNLAYNFPTPLQIYTLQQDLWLLEAVFNIIKEVNGDANANDLAKIKRIDHIAFGREAHSQLGELSKPNPRLASSQSKEDSKTSLGKKGKKKVNNRRGRGKKETEDPFATNTDKYKSPFHGRYVNKDYEPITAEDVRQALDPNRTELPDKYIELVVAKRIPVRIAVRMDERAIPDFISKSASHPFAFEINQVRINKHVPGEGIVMVGALGAGGRGPSGAPEDEGRGASIGAGGGAGMAGGEGELPGGSSSDEGDGSIETRTNYDVDVEFYGIVKIYNPVNRALLTGEKPNAKDSTNP